MLALFVITIFYSTIFTGLVVAQSPIIVKGNVYINGKITKPDEVSLLLPDPIGFVTVYEDATLYEDGRYIIIFYNEEPGTIGTFLVIYQDKEYTPTEIFILEENQNVYIIDLHIETNGESLPPPEEPITNIQPKAIASGPYYSIVNESFYFNGNKSYDSDGSITKYEWDFGNGLTDTGISPTFTYQVTGNYRVTLTVTDNKGKTDLDITYAYITELPNNPPNKPNIEGTTSGSINTTYVFTLLSTDPDNNSIRYYIEWNDDSNKTISDFLPNGTNIVANHSWIFPGIFIIKAYTIDEKDVFSNASEHHVLIDTIYCEDIGYMTDYTGDGFYDLFHSNITGEETPVELNNGFYLIDFDNNGRYEFQFNTTTSELSFYSQVGGTEEQKTNLLDMINPYLSYIIIAVLILLIFLIILLISELKQKPKKIVNLAEEKDKIETEETKTEEIATNIKDKESKSIEEEIDELFSNRK